MRAHCNAKWIALALPALLLAACTGGGGDTSSTSTGAGGGGAGGGGTGPGAVYPDIASVFDLGVARTCSLNQGVCHASKAYPELGSMDALLSLVGAPCQLGAQDPSATLDECEIPGDLVSLGGADYEILSVAIADDAPFPPKSLELVLASAPASLDSPGAIRRPGDGQASKSLAGVVVQMGTAPGRVALDLAGAKDATLASFLDVRAWDGDRVRMGDPNGNGKAHASTRPWAEITPGDPARSFLYKRLLGDAYGPVMPLIPRTWSPAATRALWCWIRGLSAGATPSSIDPHAPIPYDDCPADPDAPDPDAAGGWPAVQLLVQSKCATAPCHSSTTHSEKLDLTPTPAVFASDVVNAPSFQVPGVLRVMPGQPAASYLLCKVDPACTARKLGSEVMPINGTELSEKEIQIISDWILNGAKTE